MAVFKDAPSFGTRISLKERMKKADAWIKLTPEEKTASVKAKYATLTPKQRDFLNKQQFFLTEVVPLLIPGAAGVKFAAKLGSRMLPGIQKFFNIGSTKLPEGFNKLLSSYKPSKVVKLPKSPVQRIDVESEMRKAGYKEGTPDYDLLKAIMEGKNRLSKLPPRGGNVISLRAERLKRPPKKARGGKIKKNYARGGGIRKPKKF